VTLREEVAELIGTLTWVFIGVGALVVGEASNGGRVGVALVYAWPWPGTSRGSARIATGLPNSSARRWPAMRSSLWSVPSEGSA
jgi:hypothetical protein